MRPADVRPETMPLFDDEVATLPPSTRLMEEDEPEWGRWPTAPYIVIVGGGSDSGDGVHAVRDSAPEAGCAEGSREPDGGGGTAGGSGEEAGGDAACGVGGSARVWDWRVIAYTYIRREDAEKKAAELAKRYPDLRPAAFSPRAGRWLVSLGGVMSRTDAIALRAKALSMGFPERYVRAQLQIAVPSE